MQRLPDPYPGALWLVVASTASAPRGWGLQAAHATLWDLSARLALGGKLRVLDGGNCFNAYAVARQLGTHLLQGRGAPGETLNQALDRISIARAFTCYQMQALLADCLAEGLPTLALDLLATFYDENVPLPECQRLLSVCIKHLQRLSRAAPLVVTVHLRRHPICVERESLLAALEQVASRVWVLEAPRAAELQPRLPGL